MNISPIRKTRNGPTARERWNSPVATLERPAYPAKRLRAESRPAAADKTSAVRIESLDGVIHEWVRQYQPVLFEKIGRQEAVLKELAAQREAGMDAKLQEALRVRLESEKSALIALIWDAIALFEGKPLTDPLTQGYQLGLLVPVVDPAGRTFYVARGLLDHYLKEGYELVPPAQPTE